MPSSPNRRVDHFSPLDWTESDLIDLIQQEVVEEGLVFRPSASLQLDIDHQRELAIDASSLANSQGGVIIYGIRTRAGTNIPEALDEGTDANVISRSRFRQVLSEGIEPPVVPGINLVPLTSTHPERVAYVVKIDKGQPLHQSIADRRYYKLNGSEVLIMTHAEIYNVFTNLRKDTVPEPGIVRKGCLGLLMLGFLILGSCVVMCTKGS